MRIFRFSAEFNDVKACGAHRRAYFLFCSMILHFKVATVIIRGKASGIYFIVADLVFLIVHIEVFSNFAILIFYRCLMRHTKESGITMTFILHFQKTLSDIGSKLHHIVLYRHTV